MKHTLRLLLTLFMVLTMALSAVTPVFAEDPPPPPPVENPDGSGAKQDKTESTETSTSAAPVDTPAVDPTAGQDAGTTDDFTQMPNYSPGGAANSGMGTFQGEELINTSGNPVDPGTDLAALLDPWAMACPPGAVPFWYTGGTCFNTQYAWLQDAIYAALPGWTVWMQEYFWDGANHVHIDRPLTLQGSPLGSAYIGDNVGGFSDSIYVESGNVTIRDVYANGMIYVAPGYTGALRLQDVNIYSPNWYGLWVAYGYSGNVILSQVYTQYNYYRSSVDLQAGTGTITVVNSVFNNTQWDDGLELFALNTVKLENVSVTDNYGDGLYVEYAKGLSIKNGIFNDNFNGSHTTHTRSPGDDLGYGIQTYDIGVTRSAVLLQNVYAAGNDEDGVYLTNAGPVTIQNAGFNGNWGHGIFVNGFGAITLDGVTASDNSSWSGQGADLWTTGAVNVSNSSFEYNHSTGLLADTLGAVSFKGVKAAFNWGSGAEVYNDYSGTTQGVNVVGGYYDSNDYAGLYIRSRGNVTLNGIVATWNNGSGGNAAVDIDNCDWNGSSCSGRGNVTLTNSMGQNVITTNWMDGLRIETRGTVSINTLTASDNVRNGIGIDNCQFNGVTGLCTGVGNVSLTNATANNNGQNDIGSGTPIYTADGLDVYSGGSITLDKVTTNRNTGSAIYLTNSDSSSAKTVTLKNVYALDNDNGGMVIFSNGAVSVNHINSIYNGGVGFLVGTWGNVTFTNTLGTNLVSNNTGGVNIENGGSVNINGLLASNNFIEAGLYVNSTYGIGSVTITNSQFNDNNTYGLNVFSMGNISLTNVQVNMNHHEGAWLQNFWEPGKTVTVNKSTFNMNGEQGLVIDAGGNITLNGIAASYNAHEGLWVRNDYFNFMAAYNVTINSSQGVNAFNNNGYTGTDGDGVYIQTSGNVTISKTIVSNNYDFGIYIYHTGNWSGKKITLTCSTADNNFWAGIYVGNGNSNPINVYLNGSGATGNWLSDYNWGGNTVTYYFTRTNCP
jgi:parallel beta-helix repeat protein